MGVLGAENALGKQEAEEDPGELNIRSWGCYSRNKIEVQLFLLVFTFYIVKSYNILRKNNYKREIEIQAEEDQLRKKNANF